LQRSAIRMPHQATLTPSDVRLLSGAKGYFFHSCVDSFSFLTPLGFRCLLEDVGRDCYRASFKQDRPTGYFTIRVYFDCDDMLWCDLEGYSGEENKLRLNSACETLGLDCPPVSLPKGSVQVTVQSEVGVISGIIRNNLSNLCELVCKEPISK